MTDDEINDGLRKVTEYFTGITSALSLVIRGLQAQPGYDHQVFLRYLAAFQVTGEKMADGSEIRDRALQETLEQFSTLPPEIPPFMK